MGVRLRFAWLGLTASLVLAQAPDTPIEKAFSFSQIATGQDRQELAAIVRNLGDGMRVEIDSSDRLSVFGKPDQVEMAEWLKTLFDRPAERPGVQAPNLTPGEFRFGSGQENTIRLIYLPWVKSRQDLAEITTIVRSIGGMRRVFFYNRLNAIAVRGNAEQVAVADWLVGALRRTGPVSESSSYRLSGVNESYLLAVADLGFTQSREEMAEASLFVRGIAVMQGFTYSGGLKIAMLGSAEQIKLANWLFQQMANRPSARAVAYEAGMPTMVGRDRGADTVRNRLTLFFTQLPRDELNKLSNDIREAMKSGQVLMFGPRSLLAVWGNATQVAAADRLLRERGY